MEWIYAIGTVLSAIAAILAWLAKLRWANEFKDAKEAQIQAIERELQTYKEITPMKVQEYLKSTKETLEEYNNKLLKELEIAQKEIDKKDKHIKQLGDQQQQEKLRFSAEQTELSNKVISLARELDRIKPAYEQAVIFSGSYSSFTGVATPTLLSALGDDSSIVRAAAVEALGKIGGQEALSGLLAAKNDAFPEVRKLANEALGKIQIDLTSLLVSSSWKLIFRPPNQYKQITFLLNGKIGEGQNQNENTWRIRNDKLELIQEDGHVHSRFSFDKNTQKFIHTNDQDTRSIRDQIIQLV